MVNNKDGVVQQIHAGRRSKLRERFLRDSLSAFNECEVIEFALGFCIPRLDTNPAAHRLINKFGSLPNIIDALPSALQEISGIGENAAVFLSFLKQFNTYTAALTAAQQKINSPAAAIKYLTPLIKTYSAEKLVILCLDKSGRVLIMDFVTNNELDQVTVNTRDLVQLALRVKTSSIILAHNHLDEDPTPSTADINLTRTLTHLFCALNIDLADHIIFAKSKHYSFLQSGTLSAIKKEWRF
jgi:DNA repair protein RadC